MPRIALVAGLLLAGLTAGTAKAQLYPPFPRPPLSLYDHYLMPPYDLGDTRRHDPMANPECGAANPQGGIPTAVTGGSCP